MNIIKSYSRRSLIWTILVMLFFSGLFCITGFRGWQYFFSALPVEVLNEAAVCSSEFKAGLDIVLPAFDKIKYFFLPAVYLVFAVFSIFQWIILRVSFVRLLKKYGVVTETEKKMGKQKKKVKQTPSGEDTDASRLEKKEVIERNKRFYIHLLSVLQREGRLLDFFGEELGQYEDVQIGAAVRSIHEQCKKSVAKYINPKAVIDKTEGDQITVESGFDASAIKLTGNVTGDPPFKGILRHKGWKASKIDLPTLSVIKDSSIISPAEVEII